MTSTVLNTTVDDWVKSAGFIVGCYNIKDMIPIPGTRWIVGSDLSIFDPGMANKVITKNYLHLFDADHAVFKQAAQDGKTETQVVDEDKP